MTARTTFFTLRAVGPYVMMADACDALPDRAEFERRRALAEHSVIRTGSRCGHWSREALERLAARHGMELVSAHSIARDGKGWIEASRRDIVFEQAAD
ncbi:MAG: hypothetical protein RIR43_1398 [Pseudomonadota bacterium]|jgi:hypothetical protein